jgi:protein TonB
LAVIATPPGEFGSGGQSTDAISISIVSASALESRERTATSAARAASNVAARDGESETETTAAQSKPEETAPPKREETPPDVQKDVATTPTAPEEPAPEIVPDATAAPTIATAPPPPEPVAEPKVAVVEPPPERPEQKPEEKPKEEKPKEETAARAVEATAAGGASSIGSEQDHPASAAAAAVRQGDANAYGLEVQAALMAVDKRKARERLVASRVKGTVVLRLVIAGDGALERADIQKSSGHRQLDEAAVQLVRMTAFPRPPSDLTADQRAYIAPIVFR